MNSMRRADQRVLSLQKALQARATKKTLKFWQAYLRGEARFRGVSMADIRTATHAWWKDEDLARLGSDSAIQLALRLIEQRHAEDKQAGILMLSELLLPHLSEKHLPLFEDLFTRGHISDWSVCDWFCIKVLARMMEQSPSPGRLARKLSQWRKSKPLWQRRAACVAFVPHARFGDKRIPGLSQLIITNAQALLLDPERFAQTGVGWVLRELSLSNRGLVVAFAETHLERMSRECIRSVTEKMPATARTRLLKLHSCRVVS